jgi:CSLREA domain-containing protein
MAFHLDGFLKRCVRTVTGTILAALLATILSPLAARASCTVTTLADSADPGSPGELRYCVDNVGGAITFSPSLNGGTITVGSTLSINETTTIAGPGANLLTISGGNAVEIFDINTGVTATISGLTIANGNAGSVLVGGGIASYSGSALTVSNSTFSGNTAVDGGGIETNGTLITLNNSIVAGNTSTGEPGDDCDGCGTPSNNLIGGTPQLAPLGWYGGSTQTMLPLRGSPAIGAGLATATDKPNMDQRGFGRHTTGPVDLGAVQTNYLIVTTAPDTSDGVSGCNSIGFPPPCSLRDALTAANADGSADIVFEVTGTITLNSALPSITGNLDLFGPGATILTVSGGGSSAVGSVFTVSSTANAAISGITIANGNSSGGGGIISSGTLTVSNSAFSGNNSPYGGGIYSVSGTLIVTNSTFSGNSASNAAGGIYFNNGTLAVTNSTFSGNTGGGIIIDLGTLTVNNSILTGDTGGECSGTGCPTTGNNGNVVIATPAQPILAPLGWYGGPTQTMLPLPAPPGSTAICAGSVALIPGGVTTDQRGFPRTNPAGNCVDAGAVQTNYLIVTTTTDQTDASAAKCDANGDAPCSLRDALTLANPAGTDIFAAGVTGIIALNTVNTPLSAITGNLDLFGPGANNLTVSGGNSSSVGSIFTATISADAAISGLTIANGNTVGFGGGIFNAGTLTVSNSAISGNATASNLGGGGVDNGGTLTVNNSTFSGNTAGQGGGIRNVDSGALTVTNSTFSGNIANEGGGIYNGAQLTVNNSTFSGNTAAGGGSGILQQGQLTLNNSIVAGNTPGDDCFGCLGLSSYNLIGSAPQLAPLGWYGGSTQTMLPLPGSPAICAGSAALDPLGLLYDQRGFPRLNTTYTPGTPCLDLGAVQTNYSSIQFAQPTYSGLTGAVVSTPADPVVSVTENGQNIGAVPVTLSFSGTAPSSVTGNGPVTTVAGTGATFSALRVSPGDSYTLLASLAITSSVTISNTAALNIDTPATVTSVTTTSPSGTYTTGAVIYVSVNFSKAVTVTGTPTLALNSGATVNYSSGSSSSSLVFKYTVASPQSTAGLDVSSSSALSGTIQDSSSVAANLTLPTGNATGIVINTTQYTLTIAASPSADGTVKATPTSTQNVTPTLSPGTYLSGTQVTLSATASSTLYKFSNWTGTTASTSTPLMITMTKSFSETANFVPNTVGVTIATSPSGLSFSVDGTTYTSTQTLTWTVGSKHTIATTTPQRVTGISYENPTWSDGGAISHTVTASVGTTSYTATFEVYYALTTVASPSAGGTVTPSLGGFFPAGSVVSIQASPKSGYTFKNWTGPVANATEASTTVTMTAPETVTANFAKK